MRMNVHTNTHKFKSTLHEEAKSLRRQHAHAPFPSTMRHISPNVAGRPEGNLSIYLGGPYFTAAAVAKLLQYVISHLYERPPPSCAFAHAIYCDRPEISFRMQRALEKYGTWNLIMNLYGKYFL
jgi:hypothetical protein